MLMKLFNQTKFILKVDRFIENIARDKFADPHQEFADIYKKTNFVEKQNSKFMDLCLIGLYIYSSSIERSMFNNIFLNYLESYKRNNYYNDDEVNFLKRYALKMVWIFRGADEQSCILRIIDSIECDTRNVRKILINRFSGS